MKINNCSPSSINSYRFCPFQYYLNKILAIESPSGKAATIGKIIHRTFELMARLKKVGKTNVDPLWLLNRSFDEYHHLDLRKTTSKGESADYKRLKESINKIINNQYYNPYNLEVVDVEKWFELEFPGDEWKTDNGQFKMRGVIDLIHKIDNDTIEIIDWKNGKQSDLKTMIKKDFYYLLKDIQPRLYHLMCNILLPQYKNILITIYYINEDGPITLAFNQEDTISTINYIWKFFNTVKSDTLIRRNRTWKCKMCGYYKNGICDKVWSDLSVMGEKYIICKYKGIDLKNA